MPPVPPQRHLVVFDCNVYLDAARVIGTPFAWGTLVQLVAQAARDPYPHPSDPFMDSLRALAACESGVFAGAETLEVWTNEHIDRTLRYKARQAPSSDRGIGGLGWTGREAEQLVTALVEHLTEASSGGSLGMTTPDGNPPLDHEDGMVFGACRELNRDDPTSNIYCVTRDRGFRQAYQQRQLSPCASVLTPAQFVLLRRSAVHRKSVNAMRPK